MAIESMRRIQSARAILAAGLVGACATALLSNPSRLDAGTGLDTYDYRITDSSNPYIALGNDPKYAAVGAVLFPDLFASGIVISPKWVLTAAHVTQDTGTVLFNVGG